MPKPLRIGLAGLGTVGAAVYKRLRCGDLPVRITAVTARDRHKQRDLDLNGVSWFDDPVKLAATDTIDLFVELIGGSEDPAKTAIITALETKKPVITANKALLSHHGTTLIACAEQNQCDLGYEAAIAGGIPIIRLLREALIGDTITAFSGILNGTCNYILTTMESASCDFPTALRQAQQTGYAEADPSFDINGQDSAQKLALLSCLAFGVKPNLDAIAVDGIANIENLDINHARDLGYRIKLLGEARSVDGQLEQQVAPVLVSVNDPVAHVNGALNSVSLSSQQRGTLTLEGLGAGGEATAAAVVDDIASLASSMLNPVAHPAPRPFIRPATSLRDAVTMPARNRTGRYMIRIFVPDQVGVIATLAGHLAEQGISLETITQKPYHKTDNHPLIPVIITTHHTRREAIDNALNAVNIEPFKLGSTFVIRISEPAL